MTKTGKSCGRNLIPAVMRPPPPDAAAPYSTTTTACGSPGPATGGSMVIALYMAWYRPRVRRVESAHGHKPPDSHNRGDHAGGRAGRPRPPSVDLILACRFNPRSAPARGLDARD